MVARMTPVVSAVPSPAAIDISGLRPTRMSWGRTRIPLSEETLPRNDMTKALAETQVDLTKEFVAAALGAIDEDSKDLAAAVRWKGVATEVFEASMANGLGLHVAMETAIKTVGFPSAGGSNG